MNSPDGRESWLLLGSHLTATDIESFTREYLAFHSATSPLTLDSVRWKINGYCVFHRSLLAHFHPESERFREAFCRHYPDCEYDSESIGRLIGVLADRLELPREVAGEIPLDAAIELLNAPPTETAEVASDAAPGQVAKSDRPSTPPEWVYNQFRQQQQQLLIKLWGNGFVPADVLASHLGYTDQATALDNLHRRVTATNEGLAEKLDKIGETWAISQHTRDDVRCYYLHCENNRQK